MTTLQTSPLSDSQLLDRFIRKQDDEAFALLMSRHWSFVYSVARTSLNNPSLAEDATQQAFIALSKRAKKLSQNVPLGPWLYRAVRLEASNIRRRENRHQKRNRDYQAIAQVNSSPEDHLSLKLHKALSSLPEKERQLIILRYYQGLTSDQIATRLKISPAAAQRRCHRALDHLSTLAKSKEQDQKSFSLALPALLSPSLTPAKGTLTKILSSPTTASASLLLPTAGWLLVTTLSVTTVKQVTPKPTPQESTQTQIISSNRVVRTPTLIALPDNPDLAQFITLARTSPAEAFTWSRERFPLLDKEARFLQKAAFHLAENDPDLAKTLLASREATRYRKPLIAAIIETSISSDFPATIQWLESLPNLTDYQACYNVSFQSWEQRQFIDQLETALAISTKPTVQIFLARNIVDHYREIDETKIITLAESLDGEVKEEVLGELANIQLDRDSPMANELITELKGDIYINESDVLSRNPARYLEATLPFLKGDSTKTYVARSFTTNWFEVDPEGALAWVTQNDPKNTLKLPANLLRK